jgi:hypothetical protein
MSGKGRDRTVWQTKEGLWANKRNDAGKAAGLHTKQSDAIVEARANLTIRAAAT